MLKANAIKFPSPIKMQITNFTLYKQDINYDFVKGINLIIGGNGTGKTTFINILKFALIGLYKSEFIIRTYKTAKIERRDHYPYDYFSSRMRKDKVCSDAKVLLEFAVGDTIFTIVRNLSSITLEKVMIRRNGDITTLDGKIIDQKQYDKLINNDERIGTLQYQYEQILVAETELSSFEDLILFVNDLLMFDERRKTVLWNSHFQTMLLSRYFNDPILSRRFDELQRDAKYNDSLSRHKSEDARAVKKILDSYSLDALSLSESASLELRTSIYNLIEKVKDLNDEEKKILYSLKSFYGDQARIRQDIDEKEFISRRLSNTLSQEFWQKLNLKYEDYSRMIDELKTCPMCNNPLPDDFEKSVNHCFLCGRKLIDDDEELSTESLITENAKLDALRSELINIEKAIVQAENKQDQNKKELLNQKVLLNKQQIQLYSIENSRKETRNESQLEYVKKQYDSLLLERDRFKDIAIRKDKEATIIALTIDEQRIQITKELSRYFESYASRFTGIASCYLKYGKDEDDIKRYIPVIGNIDRLFEESLSESQRFFIDHSFRMSVLEYFYFAPSFFICETPESSLDLSYEENAARIFLQYVNRPNVLILTLNLNNNQFLRHIIKDRSHKINYLNLLKLGYCSSVQESNLELSQIAIEIEESINGKQ
ncbi:hypothetical protein SpiGrapes_1247 [Sphaerochaeta pleomorpha str. Grapes]|uniref:Rad50/SbcC-type AAA domain-containing protein n=1 Tax=Sphaerochaeta pleomorpha (strain ATCC BAA-1885 / DSM 22778 / Grapes) TaxID=158190 RepID=G8QT94_SPHPG|nr:AAA family ATPase [Sphaerochaeta pleomorpha]AEV29061.1 hypothetical protein SpiGrapes_1247 [Sphaerochaeta pleomorpha str. Grapes]